MVTIYVTEEQLALIRESKDEVTFYEFFNIAKKYIQGLLDDPIGTEFPDVLKKHGISKSTFLNKMLEKGIVRKSEDISEPNDADGNMTSQHSVQYSVPRKDFEQKIHRLYSYFFER